MSSTEKFCLRWNDFETNISNAFREIREDKDFFDVTLACEDEQISAHKVILSACSPFFKAVLKRNRHEHPLLYLKGVKYPDLLAVLNFMYHGEVNVAQEDLNTFLAVAEDLKVKGLTQNDSNSGSNSNSGRSNAVKSKSREPPEPSVPQPPPKKSRPNPLPAAQPVVTHHQDVQDNDIQEVTPVKTEPVVPAMPAVDNSAMATVDQYTTELVDADYGEDYGEYETGYDGDGAYDNNIVDPNSSNADGNKALWMEVKSMMITTQDQAGFKVHSCSLCSYSVRNTSNLRSHIEAKHTSDMYACEHCSEKKRTWQGYLGHLRGVHGLSVKSSQFKSV